MFLSYGKKTAFDTSAAKRKGYVEKKNPACVSNIATPKKKEYYFCRSELGISDKGGGGNPVPKLELGTIIGSADCTLQKVYQVFSQNGKFSKKI